MSLPTAMTRAAVALSEVLNLARILPVLRALRGNGLAPEADHRPA